MKFAFIENRYKTIFWEALAQELRKCGHAVVWLVQNPVFTPSGDGVFVTPFPQRRELSGHREATISDKIRCADRNINYFSGRDRHYRYYRDAIEQWLDLERPEVVIGESTLFHELMVIDSCRRRGVPYLHPSMPGYPGGRYSVYAYDSKEPLGHNDDLPSEADCLALAEAIRKRERMPEYMLAPSGREPGRTQPLPRSLKDRLTILRGYLAGERFNTPAPWRKWLLEQDVQKRLKTWQQLAIAKADYGRGKRLALYPLQMQPEANLDVWGQNYRDQAQLVRQLADALPAGWHLQVKANPKPKYELNAELLEVLRSHPNISPVPLHQNMASVFEHADLVCTVTGTVAVECVLSGVPLIQFGPGIVGPGPGRMLVRDMAEIGKVAHAIETRTFAFAADADRIDLVKRLYATTFPGKISDPLNLPAVMAKDNVQAVAKKLLEVAKACV